MSKHYNKLLPSRWRISPQYNWFFAGLGYSRQPNLLILDEEWSDAIEKDLGNWLYNLYNNASQHAYLSLAANNSLEQMGLRIVRGVCPTDPSSGDTKIQKHIPPDREFIFGIRDVHLQ